MKKILLLCIVLMVIIGCKKQVVKVAPSINSVTSSSSISGTTATVGGNISDDGGDAITARGVVYGLSPNPTISDNKTSAGSGIGTFSSVISGLTPGQTYYFRTYATNSVGTSYGDQITFTSPAVVSTVTTTVASAITSTSATTGGNITSDGGSSITARGVCWGTAANPTIALTTKTSDGTGSGPFTSNISGLSPGITYYARAYATNSIGTSYGDQITIAATAVVATVTTTSASAITSSSATSGGSISSDGGSAITAKGVCWSTSQTPTIALTTKTSDGTGTTTFTSAIAGLSANTTYYVRAYATNSIGTNYGSQVTFTTSANGPIFNSNLTYGSITDVDGNTYKTIVLGTQTWMAENLKTTKYKDNSAIPLVTSSSWINTTTPAYCWYNNDLATYKSTYGALYNWYAVNTGKLCPTGWRVPSGDDWVVLSDYLGTSAGGKLKETGTSHWSSPNTGATNQSGFTAVPGGSRFENSLFGHLGTEGNWWTSESGYAIIMLNTNSLASDLYTDNEGGYSVRCVLGESIPPTVTTTAISNLTATSAVSGGTVSSDGGATVTARGVCWATTSSPTTASNKTTDGTGTGDYTSTITGLVANTIYYVRAYATNSAGTNYGSEVTISTYATAVVNTSAVTAITSTTATCGGTITSGLALVTANGVCLSTSQNPTIANQKTTNNIGNASFTSSITGLTAGTIYYVRAYATTLGGTTYGNQVTFTTLQASGTTVSDLDGNTYSSVVIGTQVWMASNLMTTKYNDGTSIPLVTDGAVWLNLSTPAYCWYDNLITNKSTYGALYNWFTVNTAKLCPSGWHMPSDAEWTTLTTYLGGLSVAGGKLKSTGTTLWQSPNTGATNESGFTALPGGYHSDSSNCYYIGQNGLWWSSTGDTSTKSWGRRLYNISIDVTRTSYTKQWGMSVRCVKD